MSPQTTDRGQVVAVEVILLLALLIIAFGVYQAMVVPTENAEIELQHNDDVQGDLEALRASLLDIHTGEAHRPVTIELGTTYPPRILAINPTSPTGQLTTEDYGDVSFDNVEILGEFEGDPNEQLLETTHETSLLHYQPNYNEFKGAPATVFEHSLLYNRFDDGHRPIADQQLVQQDARTINLVLYEGDLTETGDRTTLHPRTLDGPTEQLPVTASTGETFEIVLPTMLPEVWVDDAVIGTTFAEGEPDVAASITGENEVTIAFNTSTNADTWTLQVTRVDYDGGEADDILSNIRHPDPDPVVGDPVRGPAVDLHTHEIESLPGDTISLEEIGGTISSIGDTATIRSGTPIGTIYSNVSDPDGEPHTTDEWYTVDPDESNRTLDLATDLPGTMDVHPLETTNWDPGTYEVTVPARDASGRISADGDQDTFELTILEPAYFAVTIDDIDENVSEGEEMNVSYTVENTGDVEDTQDIRFEVDAELYETHEAVTIPAGNTVSDTFTYQTDVGDAPEITVSVHSDNDSDSRVVSIDETPGPQIDEFDAVSRDHPVHARFDVSFEATVGHVGIDQAHLELLDPETAEVLDTWTSSYDEVDHVSEDIDRALEDSGGAGEEYIIQLTITDAIGNEAKESVVRTG